MSYQRFSANLCGWQIGHSAAMQLTPNIASLSASLSAAFATSFICPSANTVAS